ncbi:hypothetical protein H1Z99_005002 [Salmonella enterica subsp. enterica serovar Meleagridis]|nr:hypothetical protein [Salmonella enterica subsp. enterica serovar Cerro]EGD4263653.1 hypothetical protein [Salmonella enterica subsp. enterica serovar Cerro]EGD4268209.1 hypothetical protein [Salmonella enterica subsp. enterica serovar Cerro]EGD4276717.1 hypothetical protein [Salmonella enterica subsp. enterica serovar Meleagridis]EGD4286755.1 hypothetical protein [Salmonella enterica subsp. enterica serovar Meleagridis]
MSVSEPSKIILQLATLQQLQTEKDGVKRPAPGTFDPSATLDSFAKQILESCLWLEHMAQLEPDLEKLRMLGIELEAAGKLIVEPGENYCKAALGWLLRQHHN